LTLFLYFLHHLISSTLILSCLHHHIRSIVMKFSTAFATAASLFATASAHGGVDTYKVGSTTYQG
jgi:hypothetical protein